jgi:hypothetical protein
LGTIEVQGFPALPKCKRKFYSTEKEIQMKDVLFFDNMLTPKIITSVYWLLLVVSVITGFSFMFIGYGGFTVGKLLTGFIYTAGGCIGARIWCELLIVLFKMNEALQEIRNK